MIIHGDCLDKMRGMDANSIDLVVTDPPYALTSTNGKNAKGGRVFVVCPVCFVIYAAERCRLKWGRQTTCSRECSYILRAQGRQKSRVTCLCQHCKKSFTLLPCQLSQPSKIGAGKYCSRECRDKAWRDGANPNFIDGQAICARGSNWASQRRKALARDQAICQMCGITEHDLSIGVNLHVHHIIPFRKWSDYEAANQLSNLVTLCSSCHRVEEAKIQKGCAERRCDVDIAQARIAAHGPPAQQTIPMEAAV